MVALLVTMTVALLVGVGAAGTASAAPKTGSVTTDISSLLEGTYPPGTTGQVTVTDFANRGGTLIANGTATITDATGQTDTQAFAVPVAQAAGDCEVLNLVLGPLHLDLLGLVIDLNQVHLVITAVQAPGNLLGNLLCAITHLLDGSPTAGGLAALLNAILALLGQL
jgi:hypothetical protein